jgi:hypothetical protein
MKNEEFYHGVSRSLTEEAEKIIITPCYSVNSVVKDSSLTDLPYIEEGED